MFDASCFALLVEEILEMARGSCGGKATVLFILSGAGVSNIQVDLAP